MNSAGNTPKGWVAPFGYPRINACSRLPVAFRSVPRPSSPPGAKASTECPSRARSTPPRTGTSPGTAVSHRLPVVRKQAPRKTGHTRRTPPPQARQHGPQTRHTRQRTQPITSQPRRPPLNTDTLTCQPPIAGAGQPHAGQIPRSPTPDTNPSEPADQPAPDIGPIHPPERRQTKAARPGTHQNLIHTLNDLTEPPALTARHSARDATTQTPPPG